MKKQFIKVMAFCAMFAVSATMFTACGDDDEVTPDENVGTKDPETKDPENKDPENQNPENKDPENQNPENKDPENQTPEPEQKVVKRVYFLTEGSYKANNSTLDIYYPNGEKEYQGKAFAKANNEIIGDTGQDIIAYGDRIYMSVYGSKYLAKLDLDGKVVEKYEFSDAEGQPRQLIAKDGFVYVSLYSGQVAKFDTTSIAKTSGLVTVGNNPEVMSIDGDNLYVANSGWGMDNRLSVVDLKAFALTENIEVAYNLQVVAVLNGIAYANDLSYDAAYNSWNNLYKVNLATKENEKIGKASKMAVYGDAVYFADCDGENGAVATSFKKINSKGEESTLLEYAELASATVYLFEVDPENGDIYVGTTDYATNGQIYRFDKSGKFITKFEVSSVSPNHAAFIH